VFDHTSGVYAVHSPLCSWFLAHHLHADSTTERDFDLPDEWLHDLATMVDVETNARICVFLRIAKSVDDLAKVFNELTKLVVEQGTILDRIDYNLEQACRLRRS
jgi:hypothetical protein